MILILLLQLIKIICFYTELENNYIARNFLHVIYLFALYLVLEPFSVIFIHSKRKWVYFM